MVYSTYTTGCRHDFRRKLWSCICLECLPLHVPCPRIVSTRNHYAYHKICTVLFRKSGEILSCVPRDISKYIMPDSTVLASALGAVALSLIYLAVRRRPSSLNDGDHAYQGSGVKGNKDVLLPSRCQSAKPALTTHGNGTCQGLLDLIQGYDPELEARDIGLLMTLTELSEARMVIVVIGPPSTEVFQVIFAVWIRKMPRHDAWP